MNSGLQIRAAAAFGLVLVLTYLTFANFVPKAERLDTWYLPDNGLRLGLDLQGGIHWVVGVELDDAIDRELDYLGSSIQQTLADEGVTVTDPKVENKVLTLGVTRAEDMDALREAANDTNVLAEQGNMELEASYTLTDDWTTNIHERTMAQVLEVLRRRINDPAKGIPESVVTQQGGDRVLVQIPGGDVDRDAARNLLDSTGFLEFKIVIDQAGTVEALEQEHPDREAKEQMIVTERDRESNQVLAAYLVRKKADITGDYLADARVGRDQQGRPIVRFNFTPEGGEIFGELTGANKGRAMAIILDDNVYSAPVIQSRIFTDGQITGRFTPQEAADLAVVLRAGALSVPVVVEEERTVGPSLGADSIESGLRASVVGLVAVLAFVMVYYRLAGVYAAIALVSNLFMLFGVMSAVGATLTLPGIAGLVLTVGMAVDANVIIFERIREELRAGKTPRAAVATGFDKALWTVLDANITTLFTALVLYQYGTGPIQGFAVTLSIGIFTSVYSALVLTRILFQIYPGTRTVQQLSI